jgi:hypothetical protein
MSEYRIGERDRRFWIEVKSNKAWVSLNQSGVPRYFDSLADARSWVATIKRGVVYHDAEAPPLSESNLQWECARDFRIFRNHDAEDAPNLAHDERKAEDDTSDGIKSLEWFYRMRGRSIGCFTSDSFSLESPYDFKKARELYQSQFDKGCRYVYKSVFD